MATAAWESPQMVKGRGSAWSRVVIYGLLGFFALVYLLPLVVMLLTSFKPLGEIYAGNMIALPQQWTLEPWIKAWKDVCVGLSCHGINGYFWISIKMTFFAVLISTAIGAMNGYVLTKWRFRGANLAVRLDPVRLLHPVPDRPDPDGGDSGQAGARVLHHRAGAGARGVRAGLHHALLPQLLHGVPGRAGEGGDDRRRALLGHLLPHPAAQLRTDHHGRA